MGQARPWPYTHHRRGDDRLGGVVSAGGATRDLGRSGSCLTGRLGRLRLVVPPAGAPVVAGAGLEQATISPALIRLALTLGAGQPVVALDTTRLGPWEGWLAGIVIAGRTLPMGWAVIPYPWPKGRFRATTLALIQQLQGAFPAGRRWTLVADRGLPSAALFAQLHQGRTAFSVRLRLSDWWPGHGQRPRWAAGGPLSPWYRAGSP